MDEKRKYQRFEAPEGAIVLTDGQMGKIIDLCEGGVSFMFLDASLGRFDETGSFDLFAAHKEVSVMNIPGRKVWTKDVSFSPFSNIICGKAGIEFAELTKDQRAQLGLLLDYFQRLFISISLVIN